MKEQVIKILRKQMSWNEAELSILFDNEMEVEEVGTMLAEALAQHLKIVRQSIEKKDAKLYNEYVKMLLDEITKTIIDA